MVDGSETDGSSTRALLPQLRRVVLVALALALVLGVVDIVGDGASTAPVVAAAVCSCGLIAWWARWYRRHLLPDAMLPFEVATLVVVLTIVSDPLPALAIVVLAVKFRSLYPGWLRSLLFTAALTVGVAAGYTFTARVATNPSDVADAVLLIVAVPTVMLITQSVAIAVSRRDASIDRERQLTATALAIAGTVDRSKIASLATSAAIGIMPGSSGASAHLSPAGYGEPGADEGLALAVPGRSAKAAFLVVKVNGGVPNDARHALTALAETVGIGLSNADAFDGLRSRAECDPLTGLPTRTALTGRLRLAVDSARAREELQGFRSGLWMVVIDIDNFREVNVKWGHDTGDRVLVALARRISRCVRDEDLVARFGGDEFAVLVAGHEETDRGEHVADRIHSALREPLDVPGLNSFRTSASLGVGRWQPGMSADDLLNQADEAMYLAKQAA